MLYCTKAGEGDRATISEVITLLKRLNLEINSTSGTGVQLLKKSILNELNRYFVTTYGIETRKEYAVALIPDLRRHCSRAGKMPTWQNLWSSQLQLLRGILTLQA